MAKRSKPVEDKKNLADLFPTPKNQVNNSNHNSNPWNYVGAKLDTAEPRTGINVQKGSTLQINKKLKECLVMITKTPLRLTMSKYARKFRLRHPSPTLEALGCRKNVMTKVIASLIFEYEPRELRVHQHSKHRCN